MASHMNYDELPGLGIPLLTTSDGFQTCRFGYVSDIYFRSGVVLYRIFWGGDIMEENSGYSIVEVRQYHHNFLHYEAHFL